MGSVNQNLASSVGAALFGATRQTVLGLLFGHAEQRFYQRQIIRAVNLGSGTVQRELEQLVAAGILIRTMEGRQTYFQANRQSPIYEELRGLIRKTFGLANVLKSRLATLDQVVQLAFIYGSMAAGNETADSDIDIMVVGEKISLREVVSALSEAQRELGRELNPTVYRTHEFCRKLTQGHHFLTSVINGPRIFLIGDDNELARLAQIRMGEVSQDKPAGDRRPVRHRG